MNGNWVFADVIKIRDTGVGWVLIPVTCVCKKRPFEHRRRP